MVALLNRFPVIVIAGGALLGWIAGEVLATDPGSVRDFQAFARQTGNDLIDQQAREVDGKEEYTHLLRRR